MNFEESERYLLSLGNEVSAMKLGLDSVRKLLDALGNPQDKYLKVQVAGTNGKGSVCAFLNSICVTAGISTGMYTSPHLVSITERIKIDRVDISESEFAKHATHVREISETLVAKSELESVPTFFEQVTAIALLAFAKANVELAILETGLGGRLDATTAAKAEIAAITRIDLDHQKYLGETIDEIAAEKAAIIRPDSIVVIGEQEPDAMKVILERCREVGVQPTVVEETGRNPSGSEGVREEFGFGNAHRIAAQSQISNPKSEIVTPPLGLAGRHQIENAMVAKAVAEILRQHFPISEHEITSGLQTATHPGRLERIGQYLLDGAHNTGGAKALKTYLDEFVQVPITMIYGTMDDKHVGEIGRILFSKANTLILTQPTNSRAMPVSEVRKVLSGEIENDRVIVTGTPAEALAKAHEVTDESDLIVVTGSLYLVGDIKALIEPASQI